VQTVSPEKGYPRRSRRIALRVFLYFCLVGHDIVGIHGRAARSPRISPPGAGGDG
jgi:hypothetical protein